MSEHDRKLLLLTHSLLTEVHDSAVKAFEAIIEIYPLVEKLEEYQNFEKILCIVTDSQQ